MRSVVHLLACIHVLAVLLVAHGDTRAQTAPIISYTPTGGIVVSPLAGTASGEITARTWSNFLSGANATGDVLVQDTLRAKVGTGSADMALKRGLSWSAVTKGAARLLPAASVATTAYAVYAGLRCYGKSGSAGKGIAAGVEAGLTLGTGSSVACDPGQPAASVLGDCWTVPSYAEQCASTAEAAALAAMAAMNANDSSKSCVAPHPYCWSGAAYVTSSVVINATVTDVKVRRNISARGGDGSVIGWDEPTIRTYKSQVPQDTCPAYSDALGSHSAGSAKGADGKCPTGQFALTTAEQAATKLQDPTNVLPFATKQANYALANAIAKEAAELWALQDADVDRSPLMQPCTNCGAGSLSGPSTVTGPSMLVKLTAPNGTVTETVTTPKYGVTYEENKFVVVAGSTTTAPDGTTTEVTNPQAAEMACGVAGKPACNVKVDETGTPKTAPATTGPEAEIKSKSDEVVAKISAPARTELGFTWGWMPPTGTCSAFHFATNRLGDFVVDPCSKPGVHLWRSLLAWFLGALTLLYVWRSGVELK